MGILWDDPDFNPILLYFDLLPFPFGVLFFAKFLAQNLAYVRKKQ